MKDQLIFNTTDADTIADSDSVGAYVRSSDGTLITHETVGGNEHLHVAATMSDAAGNALTSTAGALDVNVASGSITVSEADVYAEDSAHTTGDEGTFTLAVRNDTLASLVDADGDYAPFQVNASGALYVDASQFDVNVNLQDGAGTDLTSTGGALDVNLASNGITGGLEVKDIADSTAVATQKDATTTAADAVTSPLANRKWLFLSNQGNRKVYIGGTGVTTAAGFPISPGSVLELRAGPAIDIEMITSSGTQDVRTLELA